jgi:uncharacterized protein (TIGR02147 family)
MNFYTLEPANHNDYRSFLKERIEYLKNQNSIYSLQYIAQKSDISKSHLRFLLNKERHISLDKFPKLAICLKLSDEEEYFVYLMICKNSSQNPKIQNHFESILSRIRNQYINHSQQPPNGPVAKTHPTPEGEPLFFKNLISAVISNQMKLLNFTEDPKLILEDLLVPNLDENKVSQIISLLEESGLIKRDEKGKMIAIESHLLYQPDPYDPNGQNIYTRAAEFLAELMQTPKAYKPSIYSSSNILLDEIHLKKTEKLLTEVHHTLDSYSKNSKDPTANVYISNFFLTLSR